MEARNFGNNRKDSFIGGATMIQSKIFLVATIKPKLIIVMPENIYTFQKTSIIINDMQ